LIARPSHDGKAGDPLGVRVVLDARPVQDPDRAPTTAAYLRSLLAAFDAEPLAGESFALLLQSDLPDPTLAFDRLDVVGRRLLPPTRYLRSGAQVVDPFLLTGASLGAAWRAERGGAGGAVYHTAAGVVPAMIDLPTVATLLDLAPWELPERFGRRILGGIGHELRSRLLRHASAVIVASEASASAARRLLGLRRSRLHVVPLAARPAFQAPPRRSRGGDTAAARRERERLGLPDRYFVYAGRYDARQDLPTLLSALARLAAAGRPGGLPDTAPWPPRVLLVGASPEDRALIARMANRQGVGEAIRYAPGLEPEALAALVRGARAVVLPALVESAGLAAIEAIACGTPVVAFDVGALPELVGGAGLLVPPRDPDRLAVALSTAWSDDSVRAGIAAAAQRQAAARHRTWADVARETRAVYRLVGSRSS
jgi:glycosyltransferase involved in cell wall biosynthesis